MLLNDPCILFYNPNNVWKTNCLHHLAGTLCFLKAKFTLIVLHVNLVLSGVNWIRKKVLWTNGISQDSSLSWFLTHILYCNRPMGPVSIQRPSFPGMGIPMSRDRLIVNIGIPILARRHLYTETAPMMPEWIITYILRHVSAGYKMRCCYSAAFFCFEKPSNRHLNS